MSSVMKAQYMKLLAKEIVSIYGVTMESAVAALKKSAINQLFDRYPEYVDHVPLSSWAKEVHGEMFE